MKRRDKLPWILDFSILVLALAGLAINLLLLGRHLTGSAIAGCGGGSGCEEVLHSRWAQVLGIPVTGFGGLVYLALLVSLTAKGRRGLVPCLGLIAGAAAWFVFVQAALLGRFCPWCMTAHGIGITLALLGMWRCALEGGTLPVLKTLGGIAAAAALGIGLLQVIGPLPVTHRLGEVHGAAVSPATAIHARGTGRKVAFDGGRKAYDLSVLPCLGRADAKRVMVEYFDYSCAACRTMRGYLDALVAKHPAEIGVVLLPVPLEHSCNHALAAGETEHPGACELARLALACWRTNRERFPEFHDFLLAGASPGAARAKALEFIAPAALDAALRDPWIDQLIQANLTDWVTFSADTRNLPKLLISDKRILHGLPSGEADFIRVMERELGL